MGNRLTKIYTRSGDDGATGTASGERIAKDDVLIQAQGDLDELNSLLGVLAVHLDGESLDTVREIQHRLFDIGGEISLGRYTLTDACVQTLEQWIDDTNEELPPLKEFILPGGNEAGACCHLARAVCRRAERSLVALHRKQSLNPASLAYVNRLSDVLFVFARVLNEGDEIYWQSHRLKRTE